MGTTRVERAVVLLLFGVATALAVATATDPDLFWHLSTGEVIVEQGVPDSDVFSFTVPGRAWVAHEWASQAFMWLVWSAGGSPALIAVFTAIVMASYAMAAAASRARPLPTAALVALAAAAARISTGPRPQMFNLAGLALLVLILERIRTSRLSPRWIWMLPPIVAVWANLHSGYLLGVAALAVYSIGERLQARRGAGSLPREAVRRLPLVAALGFVLAALNPSGTAIWSYPLETLRSSAMREHITEWASPDFHSPAFWPFLALLVVTAVSLASSRLTTGRTEALLTVGTAVAALQSMRHIQLFAVVAIPFVAPHVEDTLSQVAQLWRARPSTTSTRLSTSRPVAALTAALSLAVASLYVSAAMVNNDRATAEMYPVEAVDAIVESDLVDSRGFNTYGWGGYMIWRGLEVFIDGRADMYGDEFMERYFAAVDHGEGWRSLFDEYAVDYALLEAGSGLGAVLVEASDWTLARSDGVSDLYVRCSNGSGCGDRPELTLSPGPSPD